MAQISIDRIKQHINELRVIGQDATGGTTRLSYSPAYRQGQALIRQYMEQAGMSVRMDGVGNLIGTYSGTNPQLSPIMTGSHLDTVPGGGSLDGSLGIIASLECIHSWYQAGWRPERTVQVAAIIEEEGTRFGLACFGSRALAGEFGAARQAELVDEAGQPLADLLASMGLDREIAIAGQDDPRQLHCFVELHVEQGIELEQAGLPVGIVTAIVGIDRLGVALRGEANHAGTTRMDRRKDALVAASDLIKYVHDNALAANGEYVATVGKLEVSPNAENVIPQEVRLTIEIRAAANQVIDRVRQDIMRFLTAYEQTNGINIAITKHNQISPVPMDDKLVSLCCQAAEDLALPYCQMPSWAGHDAMVFAKLIPAAMIFAPSTGGISHSPAEASDWDAVAKAVQVLNRTLRILGRGVD